jgi:RNA polymerase sigma-70 factor (ECF subfamily)
MGFKYEEVAALYGKYGRMVLRRCMQLLRDDALAEDAAQNVFVLFMTHRDRLSADFPSSLLNRIATNHCLNLIRDANRVIPDAPDWLREIAAIEDPGPMFEARSQLKRLFGLHEESTRTMAVLHLVDGMTLEEVAKETGMSVSGVRRRLRGLRETLKELEEK